ncbi:hypothetical protein D3876_18770 [Sphingomonas cavernae]|uniref:Uncharacterized protein n=1 Tax=Sphingomonas cavernae TaxID=2320861 RepID=A0A418W7E0_9SPHN|nr:hypothetical protein D3876_18770 [Sphingomonas cavernae]
MVLVAGLAACGTSKDASEANTADAVLASGDGEAAGESPSDITAIDAAVGYAGGMSAETPTSSLPRPETAQAKPERKTKSDEAAEPASQAVANVSIPSQPLPSNVTVPSQPPQ